MTAPQATASAPPTTATDGKAFFRHARNYVSATAISGVLQFVGVAVLTRLLSPAEYGIYSIFLTTTAVLAILFELNLRGAVNRYYLERTDDFADFLRTTLLVLFVSGGAMALLSLLLSGALAAFFRVSPAVVAFAIVAAMARAPWNIRWKLFVAEQRSGAYARLAALKDTLVLIGSAGAASWVAMQTGSAFGAPGEAIIGREMGAIAGNATVVLLFALPLTVGLLRKSKGGRYVPDHARYALSFGIPLIAHSASNQILHFFDRIVINQVESARAVGLYSFAYNLGMAMGAVVTAVNQAWLPVFMDLRREEKYEQLSTLARRYSRAVVGLALVFVVFARELGWVLGDARYQEALPLVPVVVFGYVMVFLYTLYANHSFYVRRTAILSGATMLAGAINIVLNYAFVPHYGYAAAAWTTLASYILLASLHFVIAKVLLREQVVPLRQVLPPIALAMLLAAGITLLETRIDNLLLSLVAFKLPMAAALAVYLRRQSNAARREAAGE